MTTPRALQLSIQQHRTIDALKDMTDILAALNTDLAPGAYYETYITVFTSLTHLQLYLTEHQKQLHTLYEIVQYTPQLLPRLYTMITVGGAWMKQENAPKREIMMDMLDMCKGIQHPVRGLFLRHYLAGVTRDCLPESKIESEDNDRSIGTLADTIAFILTNFIEMNKLWVRLQHIGLQRDAEKRSLERKELRTLVGTSLVRLSQLEIEVGSYERILERILEQVIGCRDAVAQEYIMDCIIQVFPDQFHLATLSKLLAATAKLVHAVNVMQIIAALIDRLAKYLNEDGKSERSEDLFEIFWREVGGLIEARPDLKIADVTAILVSLLNLSISCYPENLDIIDKVLDFTVNVIHNAKDKSKLSERPTSEHLMELLTRPLYHTNDIIACINFKSHPYPRLLRLLPLDIRVNFAQIALEAVVSLEQVDDLIKVLEIAEPLIEKNGNERELAFEPEIEDLAKLCWKFKGDCDAVFMLLNATRKIFAEAGEKKCKILLPPLVFAGIKLARRYSEDNPIPSEDLDRKIHTVYKFLHTTISTLVTQDHFDISLRLFLAASASADEAHNEDTSYEFIVQAFTIYEDSISATRAQIAALHMLIGTLQQSKYFNEDNYDTLTNKCLLHAGRMMKKQDQCRAVLNCTHLFWKEASADYNPPVTKKPSNLPPVVEDGGWGEVSGMKDLTLEAKQTSQGWPGIKNGGKVLDCLQRALKLADACMDSLLNVQLFTEILNVYIYYYKIGIEEVTAHFVNGLITLVKNSVENLPETKLKAPDDITHASVVQYSSETLRKIEGLKSIGQDSRWKAINT